MDVEDLQEGLRGRPSKAAAKRSQEQRDGAADGHAQKKQALMEAGDEEAGPEGKASVQVCVVVFGVWG